MTDQRKTVLVIAGPTAVGKTAVAIQVAQHFGTAVISADSRQCYKELKIGVARPSEEELQAAQHHFIASHSIHQKVHAATFEQYALEKAHEFFATNNVVVMVGGTGLYIKAFCQGLDDIPEVPEDLRTEITAAYHLNGLPWLQQQVQQYDPLYYQQGEIQNPQRLMRALEVVKATGKSIVQYRKQTKTPRDFEVIKMALALPKEQLHQHINNRVEKMMQEGLLEEVQSLLPYQQLNALQTVGYKELFDYFNGAVSLPEAVEAIKRNTRQYAKRQMTWFKKDKEYTWFSPYETKKLFDFLATKELL